MKLKKRYVSLKIIKKVTINIASARRNNASIAKSYLLAYHSSWTETLIKSNTIQKQYYEINISINMYFNGIICSISKRLAAD